MTTTTTIRLDDGVKEQLALICKKSGISISGLFKLVGVDIVSKGYIPFANYENYQLVPNDTTISAMSDLGPVTKFDTVDDMLADLKEKCKNA
jgi:addiction module RelB/DinJ family antitoxin